MRARYGQNFLVSPHWQRRITALFNPPGRFAEIGPGRGALTEHLKNRFDRFHLFEIDPQFESLYSGQPDHYEFHLMDFLEWDFKFKGEPVEDFSLIGNLPYESASAMLVSMRVHQPQISHAVFLVQREVAERVAAKPKSRAYGSLSVLMQSGYDVVLGPIIPPGAFRPAPKVDSQVLVFHPKKAVIKSDTGFNHFVQAAFLYKRKRLRFALRKLFSDDKVAGLYQAMKWPETMRAEEIPVDQWIEAYEILKNVTETDHRKSQGSV